MTETNDADLKSAVHTLIVAQRWLGIWRWKDTTERNGIWNFVKRIYPFVLHLPLTFTFIALMWLEVIVSNDLEEAGNVLYMSLTELTLVVKLINIWYRQEQALKYMDDLDSYAKCNLKKPEDIRFWQREQTNFKRIFYPFLAGCFAVAVTGFFQVFFLDTYELPFGYYVPFEWKNPQRYIYAWSYDAVSMTVCCLTNTMLDIMGCYFMFQITAFYKLLNRRLLVLQDVREENIARREFRCIFQLHKRLRILTKQCEILNSPPVLSQVVLSALIICFSGYRLVQIGFRNPGPFLTTVQFVAVMILQIFLPCYYGNELIVNANQLTNSVFNTNWLEYSVSTRRMINCYMEFLKKPVQLRAGVFFEIGLPIFMKTINNAYSFFALIINLSK